MGIWRRYAVGKYRLQQLNGRAVVIWFEDGKRFSILSKDASSSLAPTSRAASLKRRTWSSLPAVIFRFAI